MPPRCTPPQTLPRGSCRYYPSRKPPGTYLGITATMPQIHLATSSLSATERRSRIARWFTARGFSTAAFENGKLRLSSFSTGEIIVFKLAERPGHDTYYKETTGGALIVFEVIAGEGSISYDGYCPILLFGIWSKKLSFKKGASGLFKYRDEGHRIEQKFLEEIDQL